ncbi:MAG: leucine-rich repeat protein [Muribaculaceae bacterium]|nr:leucine-rich repeat protein [Muribaculaceae bacterium]
MIKTIQQTLILALCVLMPAIVNGEVRSVDDAKEIAADFFQSGDVVRLSDKDAFILANTVTDDCSNPVCYVFNAKDGHGFAIVSADEGTMPVVGYSVDSLWEPAMIPGAAWQMISSPVEMYADTRRKIAQKRSSEVEGKLLETPSWSQEAPFNFNIPGRRLTGCVGVALAEILKYHGYPAMRPASLVKDGEATSYQWSSMRNDNYRGGYEDAEASAVAALVGDAAIGIGTDFGMSSSSAFEVKVPYALTSLFGYDAGVSYKKRAELSKNVWDEIIVREIDADRPVLYSGQDISSGHAFVCDGYEMRGGVPYFHINWGWGGSANGYYASDALNPVVSKSHSYNDLMTIVYNIKPAANATVWSDIHVTSDECQPGLTLDVSDISSSESFTVRAGALKNISNTDFTGRLAVALYDASGNRKGLLNEGRSFSLVALQISRYVDFSCKVPSGVSVADGDVVRLATQASGSSDWLPVAGDLLAPGEASAKNFDIPYFKISLPATTGDYSVSADDTKAIKGRDFSFALTSLSPDKVITVRSNGYILTPDANDVYRITNVLEDKNVDVIVQNAADVLSKSTLWVTAGNLKNLISDEQAATVVDLTLFGTINAEDFNFMRDRMKLQRLDISQVSIAALGSNPANAIPTKAFMSYRSLKQVILPDNLTTFKNACFGQTGLTSVEIPASVATWEYNVFANCTSLREVTVRRSSPVWINWCVFTNTPQAKLTVPVGASEAYKAKEYWQDFKEIVEENPVESTSFNVNVALKKGLKLTPLTEGTEFSKGDTYRFMVETDDSYEDAVMHVYANSASLVPDDEGVYEAIINANTLIHVEFIEPQPTTVDTTWKLSGDQGGIGLVSEVVNVPVGKMFTVRANAIKVPKGDDAAKFYGIVLTDRQGAIKEFVSSVVSNYYSRTGENLTYNFFCQVKESKVKEGNQLRLATSYNKKDWQLVEAEAEGITDRLEAIGNPVIYHSVTMPQSVTGARLEGGSSQVVRGMPFSFKASAIDPAQRVTVSVNGETKASNVTAANISIPAVLEDLDITVTVKDAEAGDYMVFNIQEGTLASKLQDCPTRVKLIGTMLVSDFDALRANASVIIDLDMADVTVKCAAMTGNSIPENAFAPSNAANLSALKTIVLPNNIERISKNAFARCTQISEITIPANVNFIGEGAFSACVGLKKIVAKPKVAPTCGNMSPFPSNPSAISLEVPKGSEESYSVPSTWWAQLSLYQAPAEHKDYYWVKFDSSRALKTGYNGDLNRIAVGSEDFEFKLYLPNYQQPSAKNNAYIRPGVAFKLYDNGIDVFSNLNAYHYEPESYYRVWPEQNTNMTGGQLALRWIHSAASGPWMPQNHDIQVEFYYSVNFENKEGAEGILAQVVEVPEGSEWKNVPMNYFEYFVLNAQGYKVMNTEVKPVLYKEGSRIRFQLSEPDSRTELVVELMTKVMTKTGSEPEYEERVSTLISENGIYTIPALEGDSWIRITGINHYEEGDPIPAEDLSSLDPENTEFYSELTVTGDMSEEDFETIRENFESVETLDLSQIDNEVIPEGAFAGMESLNTVILPETVTEIGAGAFAGCENIETITLPGVTSIGEGAFDGCSSLTSILIPNSDASSESVPAGAPRRKIARSGSGITAESFRGLSPNCLIYIGENEIPDSEHLNIILNKDNRRVAASNIHLDGNHPFNAPASFLLGDYAISFTADVTASDACDVDGGWSTIMLPFQPNDWKFGADFSDREGSGLQLLSFDGEDAVELTRQTEFLPNRPYLANVSAPFASVPVTFTAKARVQEEGEVIYDVPFTPVPEDLVAVGRDFSLYGSYDGQTRPVVCYALNEEGSRFVRPASDEENVVVTPFSAYVVANDGVDKEELVVGNHPLWIHEPISTGVAGTKLYRSEKIEMASASPKAAIYYTVDGSDPREAQGTRSLYSQPFAMDGESMTIKAVAEYKGYVSDIVSLDFELKKADVDYSLAQNWNWISHNVETPVALTDFASDGIDGILSQTQETVFDEKHGFVGTLTELLPVVGYKVRVSGESWNGGISGIAFDPNAIVKLHKGWNWIGTPVSDGSLLISDLFSALDLEEGDMLVGLDGFVQVDGDLVWQGSLSHMVPGDGYMFLSNSDKEFSYTVLPVESEEEVAKAPVADGCWSVDNHRYASVMPVVAELRYNDGIRAQSDDYLVAAFCGDECRGIGTVVNDAVMINVHGNAGDVISFRILDSRGEEKVSSSSIAFDEDMVSTFAAPFGINIESVTSVDSINADSFGIYSADGDIIFKGDLSNIKSVEIFDVAGVLIKKIAKVNAHGMTVEGLDSGVVTVVVRTESGIFSRKMMLK